MYVIIGCYRIVVLEVPLSHPRAIGLGKMEWRAFRLYN